MKPKAVYLNYNERTRSYYYTIYLNDNTKVYVDFATIENAKKYSDSKLRESDKKEKNNK